MTPTTKSSTTTATSSRPLSPTARKLRLSLLRLLREQGFALGPQYQLRTHGSSKKTVRAIHGHYRKARLQEEKKFVQKWYPKISHYFASGRDIDPQRVDPYPVLVEENEKQAALFRIASLCWSIPVSTGYGRRFEMLIFDRSNGKLVGLLAITD